MSIFERLKKRAAFPVADTGLFIRELTFRQLDLVKKLQDSDLQTWLTLAVKADAEEHVTAGILNLIMQAMTKLSTPANQEALAKN
jgi:hypothetical protein